MEGVVDDVEYSSAIGGVELYFDGYLEVNVELEVADEAVGTCITSKGVSGSYSVVKLGSWIRISLSLSTLNLPKLLGFWYELMVVSAAPASFMKLRSSHLCSVGLRVLDKHEPHFLGQVRLVCC